MPELITSNIDALINIVLAFITASLGLNLSSADFRKIFEFPATLTLGLIAQMVLLPLSAFVLMSYANLSPEIKVGFMIISLCPGGVTSNLVNYLLKGNLALSISLTVFNGILCMFSLPVLTNLSMYYFMHDTQDISLPVFNTILHIGLITAIPAAAGMYIREKFPNIAASLRPILKYLLPALLILIFAVKFFASEENGGIRFTTEERKDLAYWVLLLNFVGMSIGYLFTRLFKAELRDRITVMVEVGLQNTALALFIAGTVLQNIEMQKPALIYIIYTFASTMFIAWVYREVTSRWFVKKK